MGVIRNPILPGFYPDPSVCRVGRDFYLVTSTFSWYPGLPVYHSRDLVSWIQIGNVIDRAEQLEFTGQGISRGLFAPSIRHDGNRFYVTCTDVDGIGNFVVTAEDPAGSWSLPVKLDAPGIDPSLFFDDDGSAWYVGTRPVPEGPAYPGNWEVWARPFDPVSLTLTGTARGLWRGALRDCVWPEGPHLYKVEGFYYLIIAEGGTGRDHAVSVARAEKVEGPWVGKPSNPILTHRHLGAGASIVNVGHGDLFDDGAGGWWMAFLASRPYGEERCANMGRETFLAPVTWEDRWPLASAASGRVEEEYPAPRLDETSEGFHRTGLPSPCVHFDSPVLPLSWLTLRQAPSRILSLDARPGHARLRCLESTLADRGPVAFAGVRQRHVNWELTCSLDFDPRRFGPVGSRGSPSAGLALVQSEENFLVLELALGGDARILRLVRSARDEAGGKPRVIASAPCPADPEDGRVLLSAVARSQRLSFLWKPLHGGEDSWQPLAFGVDASILSSERAGGFVGTVVGIYASGNGAETGAYADFAWMDYRP